MRKCGPKRFIWYVSVCDWEACWPIAFFDSEEKAKDHLAAHKPSEDEQSASVIKAEIF